MRPVDKGEAPLIVFKNYRESEPYLEKRIGPYCSYCELPLWNAPEVEHKEAKSQGGELLTWENFLLSCKYCNTRKGITVKKGDLDKYFWPDLDDTFHAFDYGEEPPKVNSKYLQKMMDGSLEKAENTFRLIKMDDNPVKDRRFYARNEARNCAVISRSGLRKMRNQEDRDTYLESIIMNAKAIGFFSVWMNVFSDCEDVRNRLIESFAGTKKEYCKI